MRLLTAFSILLYVVCMLFTTFWQPVCIIFCKRMLTCNRLKFRLFSDFFTKFIIKHATGHSPFPVAAKCRWCIYSCRIWQTQIILCRNNAKIRNTSHRQRNQIPCQFFLRSATSLSSFFNSSKKLYVVALSCVPV